MWLFSSMSLKTLFRSTNPLLLNLISLTSFGLRNLKREEKSTHCAKLKALLCPPQTIENKVDNIRVRVCVQCDIQTAISFISPKHTLLVGDQTSQPAESYSIFRMDGKEKSGKGEGGLFYDQKTIGGMLDHCCSLHFLIIKPGTPKMPFYLPK